jgi:hypothetical protein
MLDDVLGGLEDERQSGGRDWRKKLIDDFHASDAPLAWLQQFREAAGVKDIEPSLPGSLSTMAGATFAGIFAGAAAQAAAMDRAKATEPDDNALPIIDVTAEPDAPGEETEPVEW